MGRMVQCLLYLLTFVLFAVQAQDDFGVQRLSGELDYGLQSHPLEREGLQVTILLESQRGYLDHNLRYIIPVSDQILAHTTHDTTRRAFVYEIDLPRRAPESSLKDGLAVFSVSLWLNLFGDPYLEERDQRGGGWSRDYTSLRVASDGQYIGGRLLVFAEHEDVLFPTGWGEDGRLFTEDDPSAPLAAGWTMIDLDQQPFLRHRESAVRMDILEQASAPLSFAQMSYGAAFEALIDRLSRVYAFTREKSLDWDSLRAEFAPRVWEAERTADSDAFAWALQELVWRIPDGHMRLSITQAFFRRFREATTGGIGLSLRRLDDGHWIVVHSSGPAAEAGLEPGMHVLAINEQSLDRSLAETLVWSGPFSTQHVRDLQAMRYLTRFPLGESVRLRYRKAGQASREVTLVAVDEQDSLRASSFNQVRDPLDLPLEAETLEDSGRRLALLRLYSFADSEPLMVQLWERALRRIKQNRYDGLILDLRENDGGNLYLADMLASYFFDSSQDVGGIAFYDEASHAFQPDPRRARRRVPAPPALYWPGPVAVLIGSSCSSACEFFAHHFAERPNTRLIGMTPTAGLGGTVVTWFLPDGLSLRVTTGRAFDSSENVYIEGQGVPPHLRVPTTAQTLLAEEDVVLNMALRWFRGELSE